MPLSTTPQLCQDAQAHKQPPTARGRSRGGLLALGAAAGGLGHYQTELALGVVEGQITQEEKAILAGEYSTEEKAWFAYEAGYVAFDKERFEEAVTHFQAAIEGNSQLAQAHRGLGSSLAQLKKFYRARKAYKTYVQKEADTVLVKEVRLLLKPPKKQ